MKGRTERQIGSYRIIRLLGRGTMGQVYKVSLPGLDKTAALKRLAPTKNLLRQFDPDWLAQRFIHEARVIAGIRHPNVAGIWALETEGPDIFYIMEYYNRNLGNMIGESYWADSISRTVPVEKTCHYLGQILDGLARLHHAGIIHQDIKPFNIMLSDEGVVKIVDFGLSKRRGETLSPSETPQFLGTPFYAAPEQIHSQGIIDHRADLFSAGVILYRMLTGRLPEGQDTALPSQLNPMLDRGCDDFILKAIAPDPDQRFQDAESMAAVLRELSEGYQAALQNECRQTDLAQGAMGAVTGNPVTLRSNPLRIPMKKAGKAFHLDDHYRPAVYIENRFDSECSQVLVDKATGLAWQQSGSPYPMSWPEARQYVQQLSNKGAGGYEGWRLPTMNELLSLLNPPSLKSFCLGPLFSDVQKCLWSADTRSGRAAWVLDLEMGFVTSCDVSDYFHVKAVSSL